jgi:hypothetical protein
VALTRDDDEAAVEPVVEPEPSTPPRDGALIERVARELAAAVHARGQVGSGAFVAFLQRFPEFRGSSWFGHGNMQLLAESLVAVAGDLEQEFSPWRIVVARGSNPARPAPTPTRAKGPVRIDENASPEALGAAMANAVADLVLGAREPVDIATAASYVHEIFGPAVQASRWAGAGSFKRLLQQHPRPDVALVAVGPTRMVLFDPARHGSADEVWARELNPDEQVESFGDPALYDLARRVRNITEVPLLSSEVYGLLFESIADDLAEAPFDLQRTCASVVARCAQRGVRVQRPSVMFVLRGLGSVGYDFGASSRPDPMEVAGAFRRQVQLLCDSAQMELGEADRALLDAWLLGAGGAVPN